MTVVSLDVPHIPVDQRISIEPINHQFFMVCVRQGFTDATNLTELLASVSQPEITFDQMNTSYFLGRETIVPSNKKALVRLRESVFRAMFRNADSAATYFKLPPNRVVEVGTQIEL